MNVRLLGLKDDLAPLVSIHATCFADAWDARAIADLLAGPGAFAFASDDGFILARTAAGEAEILTLAVRPAARRRGLGAALVNVAATHAQQMGANVVFLEVTVANDAAGRLYRRVGFTEAGRRKGYYASRSGTPQDALVLRSNLPLSPLGKSVGDG